MELETYIAFYPLSAPFGPINVTAKDLGRTLYRENYLMMNSLSPCWKKEILERYPKIKWILPLAYVGGIVGYGLALCYRIFNVVKDILLLLSTTLLSPLLALTGNLGYLRITFWNAVGSAGESVSAVVGLLCPPAGYYLDEKIQHHPIIHRYSLLSSTFREVVVMKDDDLKQKVITQDFASVVNAFVYAGNLAERRGITPVTATSFCTALAISHLIETQDDSIIGILSPEFMDAAEFDITSLRKLWSRLKEVDGERLREELLVTLSEEYDCASEVKQISAQDVGEHYKALLAQYIKGLKNFTETLLTNMRSTMTTFQQKAWSKNT